jgi:hypothetical protein
MATFLDIGLVEHFKVVFVVLFIFAIVYAALMKTKAIGDNKTILVIIATAVAFMFGIATPAAKMMDIILPYFALFMIFIFVILTAFMFMGGKETGLAGMFGDDPKTMGYVVLVVTIIIFLAAMGKVFFDPTSSTPVTINKNVTTGSGTTIEAGSGDAIGSVGEAAMWDTLFHPKVLGLILIMLVATLTVMYVSKG